MKYPPVSDTRIVLFGCEQGFTSSVLAQLQEAGLNVIAVVVVEAETQGDNFPVKLTQAKSVGGLEQRAVWHQIEIIRTSKLNDRPFLNRLCSLNGEILLVACFAHKLPQHIWGGMGLPCWNLHPSLLPAYRGPSPLYWQIKNGESHTGVSLHEVSASMDGGSLIARKRVPLPAKRDRPTLDHWVAEHGVELIRDAVRAYCDGRLVTWAQDENRASYYPAMKPG
jgi:methionyl-tRNA formyltransferase